MQVSASSSLHQGEERPGDPRSDQELVQALNAGEAPAFDALYHRHRDWVMSLAVRFTHHPDLALDVLQETFLYFVKKFPGFTLTCQLRTFLYPAVKNFSITALRKAGRYSSLDAALEGGVPEPAIAPDTDVADEDLTAVLETLSAEHRETPAPAL
ncbi:MAG: hypothetical protein HC834_06905 [Rhodospirillales bacterium]|nr:hypothetical protein [Rhodospirillales bacterium]